MSDAGTISKEGGLGLGGEGGGGGQKVQTGTPPILNQAQDWQTGHAVHDTSWEPGPFPL